MSEGLSLSDQIARPFWRVHKAMKRHEYTHYWLCGGRGSTKSSFAAIESALAVKKGTNVVIVRKVADTLRDSVFAQVLWAINLLGMAGEFTASVSPMEIRHVSGYRILFRGLDKPEKLKSLTFTQGYCGLVWFEEADQLHGMGEVRNVLQTLLRGGDEHTVIYSYNPPRHRQAWVNLEEHVQRDDRLVHRSCYTDVPPEWLGATFFREAEALKAHDEKSYRHEYLGEPVGVGGVVFDNLRIEPIPDDVVFEFDRIYNGVDWGFDPDPFVLVRCHLDMKHRTLYLFDEFAANRMSNADAAVVVLDRVGRGDVVMCDSSEPKSVRDFRDSGIDAYPVKKGKDSVKYGIKWLQTLEEIVIDPVRCPLAASEFPAYEYVRTRDGDYTSALPDKDDHAVDSVRYALSPAIVAGER